LPLVIEDKWFTTEEIRANPDKIYVFGDNCERKGTGGQAKPCRGEPNTIGIRTKAKPKEFVDSYWYDATLAMNILLAMDDFLDVIDALEEGKTVVFPADGFGTGLAKLSENAPKTLDFIKTMTDYIIRTWS
jgi:hypothetical protein